MKFAESFILSSRMALGAVLLSSSLSPVAQAAVDGSVAGALPSVAKMPDRPSPFVLRDWKQVARDFDARVFDDCPREGDYLPLLWEDKSRTVNDVDGFAVPSYVGDWRQTPESNVHEGITSLAAVVGASLAGIDKSDQGGRNYVEMLSMHYHEKDGLGLYLNRYSPGGASYWYDLLPNLLFFHLYSLYPGIDDFAEQLDSVATVWREVMEDLGAGAGSPADFEHTGYLFLEGRPVDRGWKEPDAAAGIACLEYLAYARTGRDEFLQAADWAFEWMEQREENPFYECLMPYGAYAAARSNAERGTSLDVGKYIEWVLAGDNPRKWGAILEQWGEVEAYGLIGSVYPNHEYAFAMNTFLAAGMLAPIARYEERYARDIAKWILNVAVNSRYFYADAWSPESQSSHHWASRHDPESSIAYEGLRKRGVARFYPDSGKAIDGTIRLEQGADPGPVKRYELRPDADGKILCEWTFRLPRGGEPILVVRAPRRYGMLPGQTLDFSLRVEERGKASGGFSQLFTIGSNLAQTEAWTRLGVVVDALREHNNDDCVIHVRASASGLSPSFRCAIDEFYVEVQTGQVPQVGGDPTVYGWGRTDLGLYGGAFVGFLGALVEPSDVDGILLVDVLATEIFPPESLPSYLAYNPHGRAASMTMDVGDEPVDVYDALRDQFVLREVSGEVRVKIDAKAAVLLVLCPSGGEVAQEGRRLTYAGTVIDYCFRPSGREHALSTSLRGQQPQRAAVGP